MKDCETQVHTESSNPKLLHKKVNPENAMWVVTNTPLAGIYCLNNSLCCIKDNLSPPTRKGHSHSLTVIKGYQNKITMACEDLQLSSLN